MDSKDRNDLVELKEYLTKELTAINTKIDRIERGMYGDADNAQTGMVESFKVLSQRIKRLESFRDRIALIITTSSAFIGFMASWLWEFFFSKK